MAKIPADGYERFRAEPDLTPGQVYQKRTQSDQAGFPADRRYWESIVPTLAYEGGPNGRLTLRSIELVPISLGWKDARHRRGRPRLAGMRGGKRHPRPLRRALAAVRHRALQRDAVGSAGLRYSLMPPNTFDRFRLTGRTALVTGARREIGRAIALALAGAGARLAIHHADTAEEAADADTVVREIEQDGGTARAFGQDFALDDAGHRLAAAVTAWSPVDILVLNASIELPEAYQGISRERFDKQISVNLRSPLELLQALVPSMAARGWGRVVTIGSVQQVRPHPQMMVYAGTKAAQLNWSWNLARQFGGHGVTVNNLAPGAILTARNRAQMATEGEALVQRIPAGRLGKPDDLAGAALLLCSDAGAYINGVNLYVDGGRSIA